MAHDFLKESPIPSFLYQDPAVTIPTPGPSASRRRFNPQSSRRRFNPQSSRRRFNPQSSRRRFNPQSSRRRFRPAPNPLGPSASRRRFNPPSSRRRFRPTSILSREPARKYAYPLPPEVFKGDGWRNSGYLPHLDRSGLIQTITFRLADSLPKDALERWSREIENLPESKQKDEIRKRIQYSIDQGYGKCHLRDPRIAELVENALLHFDGQRYNLIAWCIMPNHVHVMIETFDGFGLDSVLHSWKSFTSKEANKILQRTGTFWQREYYDRFIRDDVHFYRAKHYIEENPVKAGLAKSAGDWRWSSAWSGRFVMKANSGTEK